MMLPKVNRPLYESALFKPSPLVVSLIGLFTAAVMLIFMLAIIGSVFLWTMVWLAVGSLLFILGRRQGTAEGFDYDARMAKDMTLET